MGPVPPTGTANTSGHTTLLPQAFTTRTLHDPTTGAWNMDIGASSHLNNFVTSLSTILNSCMYSPVSVGDGHSIPVTNTGHSILSTPLKSVRLNNVLITPHIVKNLIFVRQFVRDNDCTIEFDSFGFSVKDFMTRRVLLRCNSTGDLYPLTAPSPIPRAFLVSQQTWHQRLSHPGSEVLRRLVSNKVISCNKEKPSVLCHACQLGKHVRLPFVSSSTIVSSCFEIVHSDVWTSPIPSLSGFKYYVLFLDHYSQFVWVFPLIHKFDVLSKFVLFRNYVRTQFKCEIQSFQCDHGGEFDNRKLHDLFNTNGIQFHFSYPKTSQQNGKSERMTNPIYQFPPFPFPKSPVTENTPPNTSTTVVGQSSSPPSPSPINTSPGAAHVTPPAAHLPSTPSVAQSYISHTIATTHTPLTAGAAHDTSDHEPSHTTTTSSVNNIPYPAIIPDPPVNPNPTSVHSMVTRFRVRSNKPTQRLNFHVSSVSPLPKTYSDAFNDSNWKNAMRDEYNALIKNSTWTLVPRPPDANGVDVDETFSLVVKLGTIRTVLSLAASLHWPIHQLDVKNAFLHGDLSETVYMHQPPGFRDFAHPDHVCLLQRSLYGLKQAPRPWFQRFASYITRVGFHHSRCDTSLFIYRQGMDTAYLLLYVDDIVLTASSSDLLQRIISSLHQEFAMTDLGPLNYFLGIFVTLNSFGLFLSQAKYAGEILEKAHMGNYNPNRTPVDTESKLGVDGDPVSDPTLYRSLTGSLQYLTFTIPDISYVVQLVCLHMHDPREPHLSALKRIFRYIQGTMHYGLQLFSSSTTDLVAYYDADWAGCPTTRRSTSGYCVFLGNNLLSWSSKRQPTISRYSAEAEYRGVANVVAKTCWLCNLLHKLHTPLSSATLVYCDNVNAVYLSCNPVMHQRTKHIEIDIHFVRDLVAAG
ncbi:ribonuclease H-like domain-containing protein [Tanacetum coccineum]